MALIVYGLGSLGFWAGSSFQDALIMQVAEREESNRVSALGFALGYLGGGLLFLCNAEIVLHPGWLNLDSSIGALRVALIAVAVWWILFTLPMFRYVGEPAPTDEQAGWRELWGTIRSVLRNRPVLNFLLAYWLYIDGISTVQIMATDFGTKLGFSSSALLQGAAAGAVHCLPVRAAVRQAGGSHRHQARDLPGARRFRCHHDLCLFHAIGMAVLCAGCGVRHGAGRRAGTVTLLLRIASSPRSDRAGCQYFGFYNMLAKFAAVLGPLVMGVVAITTGNQRLSILALAFFFVVGAWLLSRVPEGARAVLSA